jgi:hypothetical protein
MFFILVRFDIYFLLVVRLIVNNLVYKDVIRIMVYLVFSGFVQVVFELERLGGFFMVS